MGFPGPSGAACTRTTSGTGPDGEPVSVRRGEEHGPPQAPKKQEPTPDARRVAEPGQREAEQPDPDPREPRFAEEDAPPN